MWQKSQLSLRVQLYQACAGNIYNPQSAASNLLVERQVVFGFDDVQAR